MKPALTTEEQARAKVLHAEGRSFYHIGKVLDRSRHTIKAFLTRPEIVEDVKQKKAALADKFESLAARMIGSIEDADITKLNAYQRTLSGAIAVDKTQLLRGQATAVNVTLLLEAVQVIKDLRRQPLRELPGAGEPEG
jgi:hypothetical protein